jgi:indolepyruvate ferredoxin oxidoreductase beta subunit
MTTVSGTPINILVVGVGGQGTILASELLAHVLMETGYEVKKSEVHGMSQRGGRVVSHVRFGEKVYSPLIVKGEVDYLVGFELAETLRSLEWLGPEAKVLADCKAILPFTSLVGEARYPFDTLELIRKRGFDLTVVDGEGLAVEAGEPKTANVVLMGALARFLPIDKGVWEEAIKRNMPEKFVSVNLKALDMGYSAVKMASC